METTDPFETPMIFLRITWMTRYRGIGDGDIPSGGGAYVDEHGFGHEIFNFKPVNGTMYGYGQPSGRKGKWAEAKINLTRLGGSDADRSVSGVLAVWVSTAPTGGAFIVGWYRNATVYRDWQPPPADSSRRHSDTDCGYFVSANEADAMLLQPDERVFPVPQQGKGEFGQSNIWYADDHEQHGQFRQAVLQYIETRQKPDLTSTSSPPRRTDPLLRLKVEQVAVETTVKHFVELGYSVDSVERDNIGWDLNARSGKRGLRLEVKGLSGSQAIVELTPNEYKALKTHRDSYRICVVTDALSAPQLRIFAYSNDSARWESAEGTVLDLQEIVALRCIA